MIDIIATIILLVIALILAMLIGRMQGMNARRRHEAEAIVPCASEDVFSDNTRSLLGDDLYEKMEERVTAIVRRHRLENCISVMLTSGPENKKEADTLHHLLPGDELSLVRDCRDGVDTMAVFHGGVHVGDLMLLDVEQVMEISQIGRITGCYVGEQNCYEISDETDLRVLIFFEEDDARAELAEKVMDEDGGTSGPYPYTLNIGKGEDLSVWPN